jgi:hypothetical protein
MSFLAVLRKIRETLRAQNLKSCAGPCYRVAAPHATISDTPGNDADFLRGQVPYIDFRRGRTTLGQRHPDGGSRPPGLLETLPAGRAQKGSRLITCPSCTPISRPAYDRRPRALLPPSEASALPPAPSGGREATYTRPPRRTRRDRRRSGPCGLEGSSSGPYRGAREPRPKLRSPDR